MLSLKESIVDGNTLKLDENSILNELCELVDSYEIKWTTRADGKDAWFIPGDLSEAKGLSRDDYKKHWSDKVTMAQTFSRTSPSKPDPCSLPGKEHKLEGNSLENFKEQYCKQHNKSLGSLNSLYVVNWKRAYAYLCQGKTQAARSFTSLGADSIEQSINIKLEAQPDINKVDNTVRYSFGMTEEDIQMKLIYLDAQGKSMFRAEIPVVDFAQSKCDSRRYDMVFMQPHKTKRKVITIWELKANIVDYHNVVETVDAKRYVELAKKHYGTEHVNLVFVAPYGATPEAYERCMQYDNVTVMTLQQAAFKLLESVRKRHVDGPFFIKELIKKDWCRELLTTPSQKIGEAQKPILRAVK